MPPPTLSIDELSVSFTQRNTQIAAVRQVSLAVAPRECVGIVGESGSGKTQVFMAAMGLLPGNSAADGRVRFEGEDILGLPRARLNRIRGAKLTMIFQAPMTSLAPNLIIARSSPKSWFAMRASRGARRGRRRDTCWSACAYRNRRAGW